MTRAGPSDADRTVRLRRLLDDVVDSWGLTPAADPAARPTAVVMPVRRDGQPLVLKLTWPLGDSLVEALALRHWGGNGAVRLVAADPSRGALLLEALNSARDLRSEDVDTACTVVGGLVGDLSVPAPPGLRSLSAFTREEVARLMANPAGLPRRMVERTRGLAATLTADPACDATLVHADLHFENVLAALPGSDRPPWLAISPQALAGQPAFAIQPLLRHRVDELGTGSAFRYLVRRRVTISSEAAGVDEDQALAWCYVRTAVQAGQAARADDQAGVSFCVALLKALDG